ncbi:MAG TPA: DUF4112 domain-containing protein [Terriglobales bacterium]|nr:DUF4112 domain-containing protein [Terriglobales bacterium]
MTIRAEPEIIPPGAEPRRSRRLEDEQLDFLAALMDDLFRIPGTQLRFGLDPLVGLLPGLGDMLTGLVSALLLHAAWERGLPRVAIVRMLSNVALDSLLGSLPLVGDVFDVAWKSNRRNFDLLRKYEGSERRRQTMMDSLFLIGLLAAVLALAALPVVALVLLVNWVRGG